MSDDGGLFSQLVQQIEFLTTDQGYDELPTLKSHLVDFCVHSELKRRETVEEGMYQVDGLSPEGLLPYDRAESLIRSHFDIRVSEIVRDWETLPDPKQMNTVATELQKTLGYLNTGAVMGRAGAVPAGGIDFLQQELYDLTLHMSGTTMNAFRSQVTSQVDRVAGNCGLVAIVLGKAMRGEAQLWNNSRTNVARLLKAAGRAALATAPESSGGSDDDWGSFLIVVGTILVGAAGFAGAAPVVAGSLNVAGSGGIVAGTMWPAGEEAGDAQQERDPYGLAAESPDGVLDNLTSALADLNTEITNEETELADRLDAARELIYGTAEDYDLGYARFLLQKTDDEKIAPEMKVNKKQLDKVATGQIPDIGDQFRLAARTIEPAASWTVWGNRSESIGASLPSLAQSYEWLAGMLADYLASNRADMYACGRHLATAANIHGLEDDAVDAELRRLAGKVRDNPLIVGRAV